jgi:hypothetical protein
VNYFADVFTLETWEQAEKRGFAVSGFPPPTSSRGGYFQSTFNNVQVGDILCCYIKAPAKRWVGALRVETEMYLDYEDQIWGCDDSGRARFPARFRVSPVITLKPELGLPVDQTLGVLNCLDARAWSGLFRRSLSKMPKEDGAKLMELLREPRDPLPILVPRKRVKRSKPGKARTRPTKAPEQTELLPPIDGQRGALHHEFVWKLIQLGKNLGCDVWVASDERRHSYKGIVFSDHTLAEFPSVGLDPESRDLVRGIDVLWVKGRAVIAAFEVEVTTRIYSGLLRMSDLVTLQPNTAIDLFIVAPDERASKVRSEILRPTFDSFDPPLRKRCRFISSTTLNSCIERTKPPLNRHLNPSVIRDFSEEISSLE